MILIVTAGIWLIALSIAFARRRTNDDAWRDGLTIGVIGAATAGFFWRLLFGDVWMPAGGGDLAQFLYPTYKFAAEWWTRGVIPLWNPYLFGGAPFVGDIQSGIFYPINLLTFFISNPFAFRDMELLPVLHFFIAGAGMYLFLRYALLGTNNHTPLGRAACLAGAIAFEFSDLFITHFGNLNIIATIAWMPLVLLFYRRSVTDRRPALSIVAGILLAIAFFAGHIQMFLFIVIALGLFAILQMTDSKWEMPSRGSWLTTLLNSPLAALALTGTVAFGLSAPTLLPSLEMAQHTLRVAFPYEQAAQFSLPPAQLIGLLVPGFFGRGPQEAWGPWPRVEVGYLGVFPLLLALLAFVVRRDSLTRFLGGFTLIGLALALGGFAILHGWLYEWVPGFGQLRAPVRFIVLFDFGAATLAALSFDYLMNAVAGASPGAFKRLVQIAPFAWLLIALSAGSTAYAILILGQNQDAALFARMGVAVNGLVFFILLLGLSLALIVERNHQFFGKDAWAALALVLIFFDLLSLGAYVDLSTDNPAQVFDHPDAIAFLKSDGDLYRVDARETGVDGTWPPDTSIVHNLFDVNGDNPLVLADFDRYWQSLGSRSSRLYDLLNIKYLVGRKGVPLDFGKFKLAYDGDPAFNVFENTRVLPRTSIVYNRRVVPDQAGALAAIHSPDFDPTQTVVLERGLNSEQTGVNSQQSTAKVIGYGPNEILIATNTPSAGVLVLSEVYYPGWQAWVDDQPVDVLRADFLFRAVELPAGTHRVRLLYDPASYKIGLALFAITGIGLVGLSIWGKRRSLYST
jgi:hypothetical protein